LYQLSANSDAVPVESPKRGTTYANEAEVWSQQPFLWIGLLIAGLVVLLLIIRRKNAPTKSRLHKY
jgi:LPXTG-motif cell wall-anchored protein